MYINVHKFMVRIDIYRGAGVPTVATSSVHQLQVCKHKPTGNIIWSAYSCPLPNSRPQLVAELQEAIQAADRAHEELQVELEVQLEREAATAPPEREPEEWEAALGGGGPASAASGRWQWWSRPAVPMAALGVLGPVDPRLASVCLHEPVAGSCKSVAGSWSSILQPRIGLQRCISKTALALITADI